MRPGEVQSRPLAIGGLIYAAVSGLWLLIGYLTSEINSTPLYMVVLGLVVLLTIGAIFMILQARNEQRPPPDPELSKRFGIIFGIEGAAIGIGSAILAPLGFAAWIPAYVASVVALHFFPLGSLLNIRSDYILGSAILVLVVIVLISFPMTQWAGLISLGTAICLWIAGANRLRLSRQEN